VPVRIDQAPATPFDPSGYVSVLGFAGGLVGSAGTIANPWKVQFGTQVLVTDAGGNATITFPAPFPNGLINFFCLSGDQGVGNWLVLPNLGVLTLGSCAVHVFTANTGGAVALATVRVNWLAIGW
jgi:hypothetical protein